MPMYLIVILIVVAVLAIAMGVLYYLGKKAQAKREEQEQQMEAAAQTVSMLIIDKKMMKLKDAGLPAVVLEQTPKMLRRTKAPVVKAKVGPKIITFLAEESIFDDIPVKKEVKAEISGLYIRKIVGYRGRIEKAEPAKKGIRQKLLAWSKKTLNDNK